MSHRTWGKEGNSYADFQRFEQQQVVIADKLHEYQERLVSQERPYNSFVESLQACRQCDKSFAQQAYTNLSRLVDSFEGTPHLPTFNIHGRAAVFEAIVAFVLPYMLPQPNLVPTSDETKTLWENLQSHRNRLVHDDNGIAYRKKHSPDIVVFEPDGQQHVAITRLIEATLGTSVDSHSLGKKAFWSANEMLRSRKRGLGLFASDDQIQITFVVPNDAEVVQSLDTAIAHADNQRILRRVKGETVIGIPDSCTSEENAEVLVHINRIVLPLTKQDVTAIYNTILKSYRPNGDTSALTIEELIQAA